jgi:ribosomal protein S27AE
LAEQSPAAQRRWRAACPNCGAPVEFASAASHSAVCGFCRSTLLRDGDTLSRIGQSAEIFEDYSPLQLGATGRWMGSGFAVCSAARRWATGTNGICCSTRAARIPIGRASPG